jgi:ABC-type multidrug transport system fused ATPase/permease subunit
MSRGAGLYLGNQSTSTTIRLTQYLSEILHLLGEDRPKLPWLVLLFLASSLLDLVGIGLIGPFVALVIEPRTLDGTMGDVIVAMGLPREQRVGLILLGLLLVGIFLLKGIGAISIHRAIIHFSESQIVRLQSTLMQTYQELPYTEFLRRNSSEYVHAISGLTVCFGSVVQSGLRIVSDGIVAIMVLGLLAWQNAPALALLAGLLLAVIFAYDRLFRRNLRDQGNQANQAAMTILRGVHEGIEGLKEIRILGKEEHFYRMVHEGASEYARVNANEQLIKLAPRHLLEATLVAFVVTLVMLTLLFRHDLQALVPTLGMFGLAALRLVPSANALSTGLVQLRYHRDSISRLHYDLQTLTRIAREARKSPLEITDGFRILALDRVQFTYPESPLPALRDLSLEIRAGESIGLIGPSGSGKTTLVDVLLGLLEPQVGEVRYNERSLKDALAKWRAQVAYLPQQVFLVDDTLRRNVALGVDDTQIDEARLSETLRQAHLEELMPQLPDGKDTIIGERGIRLSGGQRQRVALARAFYHGRSVLIMDEATSALDDDTEREIIDEIRRLKGQKTIIVIAHRLTTVRYCDRIYRLENGFIVNQGTYEQVVGDAASMAAPDFKAWAL